MTLAPNETRDPDAAPTPCEAAKCPVVKPRREMLSVKVVYVMPGGALPPFECGAIQHYGCCPEHAEAAAIACLRQHLRPMHRAAAKKTAKAAKVMAKAKQQPNG